MSLRSTAARTPARRINRYYDPATDQFLSIDPLVAQSGQPYVYVNDNPLNGTDPLGLAGTPVFLQAQECKKYGCSGGSILAVFKDVGKAIVKGYKILNSAANHIVIGAGGCIKVCVSIQVQGGFLTLTYGGAGDVEKGLYVGYSNKMPSQRQDKQVFVTVGAGFGASASVGLRSNGSADKSEWEVDTGNISGEGAGVTWSKSIQILP